MALENKKPEEEEYEKNIDELTPLREIRKDLSEMKQYVFIYAIITTVLSIFLSGFIYQMFLNIIRNRTIYIFDSFRYGVSYSIILTLILMFLFLFGGYRIYRAYRRNFLMNYKDNYKIAKTETFGGAHFQTEEELAVNFNIYDSIDDTKEQVFGMDDEGKIYALKYKPGMNFNEFYCGAPGSGKSASVVKTKIYQAIKNGDSLVVTDSKGALYSETSAVAKAHGYKVRVFDLKPGEFKNSDAFNFFESLSESDEDIDSKADVLANIIQNTTDKPANADDYWLRNETNLLKCLIMHIAISPVYRESGRSTLPELYNYVSSKSIQEITNDMMQYPANSPVRLCFNLFKDAKEQSQGDIKNGLGTRLSKITNQSLQQVFSHSEIDPVEPMQKKCIYYVILSDTTKTYQLFSALFFSHLITTQVNYFDALTEEKQAKSKRIFYVLDEYFATGGVYELESLIAVVRSRKIGITIIVQNIGQLKVMYKDENLVWSILDCCSVKGLLTTNDQDTAQYFSDLCGKRTVISESSRYSESSADIIHIRPGVQKTQSESERPLILPDELMNGKLSREEILYVISGEPPVRINKYFSEKSGERIHPLEKEAGELGERKPRLHKPKWRHDIEEKQKARVEKTEKPTENKPTASAKEKQKNNTSTTPLSSGQSNNKNKPPLSSGQSNNKNKPPLSNGQSGEQKPAPNPQKEGKSKKQKSGGDYSPTPGSASASLLGGEQKPKQHSPVTTKKEENKKTKPTNNEPQKPDNLNSDSPDSNASSRGHLTDDW